MDKIPIYRKLPRGSVGAENQTIENIELVAKRFEKPLKGFFLKRISNMPDADDLVQEVFYRLVKRKSGAQIEQLEPYIFQSAANVLTDYYRRQGSRHQNAHQPITEHELEFSSQITPERVLIGKDRLEKLIALLEKLPERTRDIFVLRILENLRSVEVAKMIGVSVRSVEKHTAKALAYIGKHLDN